MSTTMQIDWGKASIIYGQYGKWLIKHYPVAFIRYFMLLNVKNYFLPPLEKLEIYNLSEDKCIYDRTRLV